MEVIVTVVSRTLYH